MKGQFTNADGSQYTVSVEGYDTMDPWDSTVHIVGQLDGRAPDQERTREFHIAARGNYDAFIARRMPGVEPFMRLSSQGGELLFFASDKDPWMQGLALWRGPFHELATYVPFTYARNSEHLIKHMSGMEFDDTPAGLVIHAPRPGDSVVVRQTGTFFKGMGFMEVYPPELGLSYVPSWTGARVQAGEIWKQMSEDDASELSHFVIATTSAVGLVVPRGSEATRVQKGIDFMSSIRQLDYSKA